jgi:hypothetical protein
MSTFSWGAVGPAWIRLYLRLAGSHR